MKPFDIEKAKNGEKVCTRGGHPVRILCTDLIDAKFPIVAAFLANEKEWIQTYTKDGNAFDLPSGNYVYDLFMQDPPKFKRTRFRRTK